MATIRYTEQMITDSILDATDILIGRPRALSEIRSLKLQREELEDEIAELEDEIAEREHWLDEANEKIAAIDNNAQT